MIAIFALVLVAVLVLLAVLLSSVFIGQRTKDLDLRVRTPEAVVGRRGLLVNVVRTDRPGV